jgi:hypothetical protein
MADSTTNLDTISASQASKEVTANALFDAASPGMIYGRHASTTSGLTWGYYGGKFRRDGGSIATIANGTVTLTNNATNYLYADEDGVVRKTTTAPSGWPGPLAIGSPVGGSTALYQIVTSGGTVTSYTDYRTGGGSSGGSGGGSGGGTSYQQVKVVAKSGGGYTSIQSAIDSISDASETKRYLIQVMPGKYTEQITMKSWVDVRGAGKHCTQVAFTGNNNGTVILASNSQFEDILIELSQVSTEWAVVGTNVSAWHVRNVDMLAFDSSYVSNGLKATGSSWATGFLEHSVINYVGTTGHGVLIQGDATTPQLCDCHMNDVFVDSLNATTGGAIEVKDARDVYLTNSLARTNPAQAGTFALKTSRTSASTVYVRLNQTSLEGTNANALVIGTGTTVYNYGGQYESLSQSGELTIFPVKSAFGVRAYNSIALSIPNNSTTLMTFNSERRDDASFHSTSVNTGRLTVPTGYAGWYKIQGDVDWASNATGLRTLAIRLNGGNWIAADSRTPISGNVTQHSISGLYYLADGDYVEMLAFQNSGGALNINATNNFSPEFSMVRIG